MKLREILHEADPNLVTRFRQYHLQNRGIYVEFERRALAMKRRGRVRYSQWTIIQAIRWDHDIRTSGDVFKINNDFIALYARLMIHYHPEFKGFFELRAMKPNGRRVSHEEEERNGASSFGE